MDKIKQLFAKLGENKKLMWIIIAAIAVVVVAAVVLAIVFSGNSSDSDKSELLKDCTVEVKSEGGLALEGIGVYIYTDSSKEELVSYNKTDKNGVASVEIDVPKDSIIILDGVPAGYITDEAYTITEKETVIKLSAKLLEEMSDIEKGGIMFDFTVTDPEGEEYTLSEILKEKKAVVLNLWYTGCQPCKAEFPYLQSAYEEYIDKIEVLAINPESVDDDAAVAAFKADNGITFPMAKCSEEWKNIIDNIAYPTTIVIDRYYSVALIHTGSIDNSKTFKDTFDFFCSDDYKQTIVESISDLKTDSEEDRDGSLELPYEVADVTEFEASIEPGKTVYYEVYGVAGKVFSCENSSIKVLYDESTFVADDKGLITFFINEEDAETSSVIGFTNESEEKIDCKIIFEDAKGTADSPLAINLGDTIVNLIAGNKNGLNYTYTSAVNGVYNVVAKKDAEKADFDITLVNVTKDVTKKLETDGVIDANAGTAKLSIDVSAGDELKIVVSAKADEFGIYPATSLVLTIEAVEKTETQPPVSTVTPDNPSGSGNGGSTGGNTGSTTGGNPEGDSGANNGGGSTNVTPPSTEDKLVNPNSPIDVATEIDKPMSFDAAVAPGTRVLYHLYKFGGTILTVSDPDVYVVYKGTKYTPQNGSIHIPVDSEGPTVPIEIEIGNSGSMNKTFRVSFYHPAGSYMNPLGLSIGSFEAKIEQGNEQGVYYKYTATGDGILTLDLISATNNANITLYNLVSYEQVTIGEGENSVSIEFYAGDEIQIIISTIPDEDFNYPATTVQVNASISWF